MDVVAIRRTVEAPNEMQQNVPACLARAKFCLNIQFLFGVWKPRRGKGLQNTTTLFEHIATWKLYNKH